jgi:hypothetical protein
MRRTRKFAMLTIDDAWLTAFLLFALDGRILTPYWCSSKRTYMIECRRIGHPNPWQFSPVYLDQQRMRRTDEPRFRPCRCWHLTRSTAHILSS